MIITGQAAMRLLNILYTIQLVVLHSAILIFASGFIDGILYTKL